MGTRVKMSFNTYDLTYNFQAFLYTKATPHPTPLTTLQNFLFLREELVLQKFDNTIFLMQQKTVR